MMNHEVRTINASGKTMSVQHFNDVNKAYEEYRNITNNLTNTLPKGYECTVIRKRDNRIMATTKIIGTK